jgi:tetratricopeptide (TPR) repeat protein
MKFIASTFITLLLIYANCNAQVIPTNNYTDREKINSIFDKIQLQGVDTKQSLLYGYFFFDNDKSKLETLKNELIRQSYNIAELVKRPSGVFVLHVEKVEQHTRQTLYDREEKFRHLATNYGVASYDGFDVGNADPTKPLVSNDNFMKFIMEKKGDDLFQLGIRLYDLKINDKAAVVFSECIRQHIKPDTASYKLGNTLIDQGKIEEGIVQLEQAIHYNPQYLNAFFNLGATCYDNMQFQKSIRYYQEANILNPDNDRILYGIAAAQYAINQFDESLKNCSKVLQLDKNNANAKVLLQMLKDKTH